MNCQWTPVPRQTRVEELSRVKRAILHANNGHAREAEHPIAWLPEVTRNHIKVSNADAGHNSPKKVKRVECRGFMSLDK